MTKLSDKKIRWICRHVVDIGDWDKSQMASHYGVSVRRVEQLVKSYRDTGQFPELKKNRRPKAPPLTREEKEVINEVWEEKRFGARLLYKELKLRGFKIPLHKIHRYMVQTGKTVPNPNKQKKRKRCRYERKHSFSLVHGDWHRTTEDHPHAIIWLDDASRFILSGSEFEHATAANSIETFKDAISCASEYNGQIRDVNTDRGAQFFNNKGGKSQFQTFLECEGIHFIPSSRNNPQTNGKLERLWLEYDRHRWRFDAMEEFIQWYNHRMHGSLWMDIGECPAEAVIRKSQPESLLGLFWRLHQ